MAYSFGAFPDTPFISMIPVEKWYLVQSFTTIPLTFIAHAIYSVVCYLLSRLMGGEGTFEATFSTQAFTIYLPTLIFMWLPELTVLSYLSSQGIYQYPWPDYVEYLRVFILPFIWMRDQGIPISTDSYVLTAVCAFRSAQREP